MKSNNRKMLKLSQENEIGNKWLESKMFIYATYSENSQMPRILVI